MFKLNTGHKPTHFISERRIWAQRLFLWLRIEWEEQLDGVIWISSKTCGTRCDRWIQWSNHGLWLNREWKNTHHLRQQALVPLRIGKCKYLISKWISSKICEPYIWLYQAESKQRSIQSNYIFLWDLYGINNWSSGSRHWKRKSISKRYIKVCIL